MRAEYDYAAQQEEELSFEEGAEMDLLEQDDPDWYLVRLNDGKIGLAPSNYVQPVDGSHEAQPQQQQQQHYEEPEEEYQPEIAPSPPIMQAVAPPQPISTQSVSFGINFMRNIS